MPSPYYMPVLRCQGLAASGGAALNRRWLTTQSGPSSVELNTSNFLRRTYGDGLTALSHAAYAEGEVHAQAVVEVELQIDKEAHTVRVLGSCRSFRHPDAGIRV